MKMPLISPMVIHFVKQDNLSRFQCFRSAPVGSGRLRSAPVGSGGDPHLWSMEIARSAPVGSGRIRSAPVGSGRHWSLHTKTKKINPVLS